MDKPKIRNAGKGNIIEKSKRKIKNKWIALLRNTPLYKYSYLSYWHSLLYHNIVTNGSCMYFAAQPNPGAGIGHQIANWIAGYWYAKQFKLKFAHISFSSDKWENFLGFYQGECLVKELKKKGYKTIRIQIFDENNSEEYDRIKKIIISYANQKVIFLAEQDQFYYDQYGVMTDIQKKFYSAPARRTDILVYNKKHYNIAVHVRRGDIAQNMKKTSENVRMRYQGNGYFVNALKTALNYLSDKAIDKDIHIYLFSQGKEEEYKEFLEFQNLHFCLNMNAQDSFLHMVYADVLITSKSSFSYKPALLNRGIRFCPAKFWHGYPKSDDWILLDETGKM